MLSYFDSNQWEFKSDNIRNLWDDMSIVDKKQFNFNMREIDWNTLFLRKLKGLRVYLLKEDPSTIPKARILLNKLKIIHYSVLALTYFTILFFIWILFKHVF